MPQVPGSVKNLKNENECYLAMFDLLNEANMRVDKNVYSMLLVFIHVSVKL